MFIPFDVARFQCVGGRKVVEKTRILKLNGLDGGCVVNAEVVCCIPILAVEDRDVQSSVKSIIVVVDMNTASYPE